MRPVPITPEDPFHWRHEEAEIILTGVRWYLDLPLTDRNVAKLIREETEANRGLIIMKTF